MKITRDLVHVIDFSSAPADLKTAAKQQREAAARLQKAKAQFGKWREELNAAQAEADAAFSMVEKLSANWSPESRLEDAPTTASKK